MLLKGRKTRISTTVGFRMGDPTRDNDLHGKPIDKNHCVFVKIKDCRVYEEDGKKIYDPIPAKAIPANNGGTYYAYGKWKKRTSPDGRYVSDGNGGQVFAYVYEQQTTYFAHDAKVYTAVKNRMLKN